MMRKKASNARPAATSAALRNSMWVLLALAGVIAVMAVVFRAFLPSSSVKASHPVAQAVEFAAFAHTISEYHCSWRATIGDGVDFRR
jgi:formate hydrogenlyase subunit 4